MLGRGALKRVEFQNSMSDFESPSFPPFSPTVFDLSDRTILSVTGEDRLRFLNGQLTQDLRPLRPERALPACVTNAKGRLQAVVWVAQTGAGALRVDSDPGLSEVLLARLNRYVVADDVVLEDFSGSLAMLHFVGQAPSEIAAFADLPAVQADRLGEAGWDVVFPLAEKEARLRVYGERLGGWEVWERYRIERGIPAWGAELGEETLPPEAGLERTHIDYHKGCYIGQEVISRLKSVGHVNRLLVRLRGGAEVALPAAGAEVFGTRGGEADLDGSSFVIGKITSVVRSLNGEVSALAYVKRNFLADEFEVQGVGRLRRI